MANSPMKINLQPKIGQPPEEFEPIDLRTFDEGVQAFLNGQIAWRRLDAHDIRRIAASRGIPLSTLGELIGVTRRTVYQWLDDPSTISIQASVALSFIDVCGEEVFRVMAEEARRGRAEGEESRDDPEAD